MNILLSFPHAFSDFANNSAGTSSESWGKWNAKAKINGDFETAGNFTFKDFHQQRLIVEFDCAMCPAQLYSISRCDFAYRMCEIRSRSKNFRLDFQK